MSAISRADNIVKRMYKDNFATSEKKKCNAKRDLEALRARISFIRTYSAAVSEPCSVPALPGASVPA